MQIHVREKLIHSYVEFGRILHTKLHKPEATRKAMKANQIMVLTENRDGSIFDFAEHVTFSSDARPRGLRGWRLPGESRAVGYWGGNQRLRRRPRPDR